ncbi:MAG: EAL domain-containing protein, partial [Actinomycetota bacterium]
MSRGTPGAAGTGAVRRWIRAAWGWVREVRLSALQVAVIAGIAVVSAGAATAAWLYEEQREGDARRGWADGAARDLGEQYDKVSGAVLGVRALFAASDVVTEDEFGRFAEVEQRVSGLGAFAWVPRVKAGDRARFEATAGFRITEQRADGAFLPAPTRAEYFPLRYLWPLTPRDRAARGLNVGAQDSELARARDTGTTVLGPSFRMGEGPNGPLGAAISAAVYDTGTPPPTVAARRTALAGYAGGVFTIAELGRHVESELPAGAHVELRDGDRTVYGQAGLAGAVDRPVTLGGRRWTLRVALAPAGDRWLFVAGIGAGGVALTVLATALFALSNRRRRERDSAQARLSALVRNSTDLICVIDGDGRIAYLSPAAESLLGHGPDELLGTRLQDLLHPDDGHAVLAPLSDPARAHGDSLRVECRWRTAAGGWVSGETTLANLRDDPDVRGWVLNTRDVTERKALEAELVHQAFHDPLTGLANRALFRDRAIHLMTRRDAAAAVLFCDLDDFKSVNDALGHQAGDDLLIEVARRLRDCVRAGDTVARLGGDEFAVLLEEEISVANVDAVAWRVLEAVSAPVTIAGEELAVSCSVGIATLDEAESAEHLLRNADVAMYAAKAAGKGTVSRYQPEMHAALLDRLSLAADLSHALEREELRVHYQPLVELGTGRVVGVEALARWEHPRRGLVSPAQFIALAEESGLIVDLGETVLSQACRQARRWQDDSPGLESLTMNVNLSARQLADPRLVERVARALADSGLAPQRLVLEITESVLMSDTDGAVAALAALKELGVRVAIDDFGTGYSSLGYLERLPVDQLKVDRIFIEGIDRPDGEAPLVQAILEIGRVMGLEVTAEGVESAGQAEYLRAVGVDVAQGYYFARPVSAGQIRATLDGRPLPRGGEPAAGEA